MASILKNGDFMALPMNIKRGNPIPIDTTMVWYTLKELQDYAKAGATAYVGQVVTLVDEDNNTTVAYMIGDTAGTLIKLASTTASGDLAADVVKLQGQMTTVLQTIEGLGTISTKDEISADELAKSLLDLINGKADKATTLEGYGIIDAYTKTEVDSKLSGAFHYKGTVDYYTELTAKTDMEQGDVYIVKYSGTSGTTALNAEYAWTGEAWEEFGAIVDLSGYQTKLTFETIPKLGSQNPVTSDGIYNALLGKLNNNDAVGKKVENGGEIFNDYTNNKAIGLNSHAEGVITVARGEKSHAEGFGTVANGNNSHAEGNAAQALGDNSHVEGIGTIANGDNSHVQGSYNIVDTDNKYAHIVGNGNIIQKSNAHTLDWNGNAWFAGKVMVGGSVAEGTTEVIGAKTLATTDDVTDVSTNTTKAISDAKEELNQSITNLTTEVNKKVNNDKVAGTELGLVKSSVENNQVSIGEDGVMTVNTITSDKISGSVATAAKADKLTNERTISVSGDATGNAKFDGSADADIAITLGDSGVTAGIYTKVTVDAKGRVTKGANITTADVSGAGDIITHNIDEFATAAQGTAADSAVQTVTIAGTKKTGTEIAFTKAEVKEKLNYIETTDNVTFTNDVKSKATTKDSADTTLTTKGYVDQQIVDKIAASNAMVYRGTLGTDGSITVLPTENVKNGDTYKVVTNGTYAEQEAFVGDMFIAVVTTGESGTSISWTRIPSGDDGNVSTSSTLAKNELVLGNNNKEITTLSVKDKYVGSILELGAAGPDWTDPTEYNVSGTDEILVSASTKDSSTSEWSGKHVQTRQFDLSIKQVSTDKLMQGTNVLILDGGSAE